MDFKKGNAGKQAKKEVADKTNAAMAPIADDDLEIYSSEQVIQMMQHDSISKAIVSMLNALKGTATPMEKAFAREVMNAPGILISFEPMKPKEPKKKKNFFRKLFSSKPKVTTPTRKYTRSMIEKKLELYFKSPLTCDAVAHDKDLFSFLMQEYDKFPQIKELFDGAYTQINDPSVLIQMIRKRFGVLILNQDDTLDQSLKDVFVGKSKEYAKSLENAIHGIMMWNAEGLKSVYRSCMYAPQGHLDMLDCLIRTDGVSHNEWKTGVNHIHYNDGNEHIQFSINANNQGTRGNAEALPYNTTHELGHVVDYRLGVLSGKGKEMRNVSKWVEVENNKFDILRFMEESIDGDLYGGVLTADELKIAREFTIKFLGETRVVDACKWEEMFSESRMNYIRRFTNREFKNLSEEEQDNMLQHVVSVMSNKDIDTNVLYHCWLGRANNKAMYHFDEEMRGMKRPFHQGYTKRPWYSFDKSRWSDKISDYQYRDPFEEFAETYASYHAAPAFGKKKGEMTPKHLLQWFLKAGLDKADPVKEKGGSAPKEPDDHK